MIFCVRSLVPDFLSSLVDSALRLPIAIERKLSRNEENHGGGGDGRNGREERSFGEFLRAVSTVSRKNSRREEEEEWEAGFTGDEREMEGLVDRYIVEIDLIENCQNVLSFVQMLNREALMALVTCSCGCLCLPPVAQCRKGHIFCRSNFFAPEMISQSHLVLHPSPSVKTCIRECWTANRRTCSRCKQVQKSTGLC